MGGEPCPLCGRGSGWGDTTNGWEYICDYCDIRFNRKGDIVPPLFSNEEKNASRVAAGLPPRTLWRRPADRERYGEWRAPDARG